MVSDSTRFLFPQLLRNGYVPIPNADKRCLLPRWSTIRVDREQCQLWTRQTRWPAIGLRVERPLLVLDYDLPNPEIARAIRDITPRVVQEHALERHGNPPKWAFYLRLSADDEAFRKLDTHRYTNEAKKTFGVESFGGGGGGAQVGSFGPHSHDEDGRVLREYSWVGGRSPATVPIWDLPVLTRAEVAAHIDAIDRVLVTWPGLFIDTLTKAGGGQSHVYDLDDSKVFQDADDVVYSLKELIAEVKARQELKQPTMRITGSFTGDTTSAGSARCKVYWSRHHGISIVDFKTGVTHHEVLADTPFDPGCLDIINKVQGRKPW
jgi:hypothetical protein